MAECLRGEPRVHVKVETTGTTDDEWSKYKSTDPARGSKIDLDPMELDRKERSRPDGAGPLLIEKI